MFKTAFSFVKLSFRTLVLKFGLEFGLEYICALIFSLISKSGGRSLKQEKKTKNCECSFQMLDPEYFNVSFVCPLT